MDLRLEKIEQKSMGKKIYPFELVGEEMEVVSSQNRSNLKLRGKVVDETKMTLTIRDFQGGKKILFKNNLSFRLVKSGKILSGKDISGRPEERVKG